MNVYQLFFTGIFSAISFTPFFTVKQLQVKDIPSIELSFEKSEQEESKVKTTLSRDFFPDADKFDFAQPIVYKRPQADFPLDMKVNYFYSQPDSIVRVITYDLDFMSTIKVKSFQDLMNAKITVSLEEFEKKYKQMKGDIEQSWGLVKSTTGDKVIKKRTDNGDVYYFRSDKWENDDQVIELTLTYTKYTSSIGTYRIRSKVYWKN